MIKNSTFEYGKLVVTVFHGGTAKDSHNRVYVRDQVGSWSTETMQVTKPALCNLLEEHYLKVKPNDQL